jgi:hypothetical protein
MNGRIRLAGRLKRARADSMKLDVAGSLDEKRALGPNSHVLEIQPNVRMINRNPVMIAAPNQVDGFQANVLGIVARNLPLRNLDRRMADIAPDARHN